MLCKRLLSLEAGCCCRRDTLWWEEGDVSFAWGRKVGGHLAWSSWKEAGRRPWRVWWAPSVAHTVRPDIGNNSTSAALSNLCWDQVVCEKGLSTALYFTCRALAPSSPDELLWSAQSFWSLLINFHFWHFSLKTGKHRRVASSFHKHQIGVLYNLPSHCLAWLKCLKVLPTFLSRKVLQPQLADIRSPPDCPRGWWPTKQVGLLWVSGLGV